MTDLKSKLRNKTIIATGWGSTKSLSNEKTSSDDLLKVSIDLLPNNVCSNGLKSSDAVFNDDVICAGKLEGGKDTCQGGDLINHLDNILLYINLFHFDLFSYPQDSGGPLHVKFADSPCTSHIIGLTSFGSAVCGLKNSFGVYVNVANYLDWIESIVWP